MALSGQNPCVHSRRSAIRSGGMDCLKREALVELRWIEDGLDVLSIDVVGAVALDRIRHEVRCELHHPGTRVLASLLVEAHGEPLQRLEQCRQQETHGSCADDVHSATGWQGLDGWEAGLRRHSRPHLSRLIAAAPRMLPGRSKGGRVSEGFVRKRSLPTDSRIPLPAPDSQASNEQRLFGQSSGGCSSADPSGPRLYPYVRAGRLGRTVGRPLRNAVSGYPRRAGPRRQPPGKFRQPTNSP